MKRINQMNRSLEQNDMSASVLVIGRGGREHAIAWKLASSSAVANVYVAPGNPGIFLGQNKIKPALLRNQCLTDKDVGGLIDFCQQISCRFVIVGPEAPLASGLVDQLISANIPVVGPTQAAARLESSKKFGRELMSAAGLPSPKYLHLASIEQLRSVINEWNWNDGLVIKADGLAAGKGVFVCRVPQEAAKAVLALTKMNSETSGQILREGLICEELLIGKEVSIFALCDGKHYLDFGTACDHKRLLDGDAGPNTGGMGAYSPAHWMTESETKNISERIFQPLLDEMSRRGTPFSGFLFAGLMITDAGPRVLEFNVRLGDPETQVLLPRLQDDFYKVLLAAAEQKLDETFPRGLRWSSEVAIHVVKAAKGYPGVAGEAIQRGVPVTFDHKHTESLSSNQPPVFFSGVTSGPVSGSLVTSGGRVLGMTALGQSLTAARNAVYARLNTCDFSGAVWRKDIGR